MRLQLSALLILAALCMAQAQPTIVLQGATIIDMARPLPLKDAVVVIQGRKLIGVGRKETALIPADAEVRDLKGKFIIPGLVNAHVHHPSKRDLLQYLAWGVTSIGGVFDSVDTARALELLTAGDTGPFPQVFAFAPIFRGEESAGRTDSSGNIAINGRPSTPEDARRQVRAVKGRGIKRIEIDCDDMAWNTRPRRPLNGIKQEILEALIDEASHLAIPICAHASMAGDAATAVKSNVYALATGVIDERLDAETIMTMENRGMFYVTGLTRYEFIADPAAYVRHALADKAFKAAIPRSLAQYLTSAKFLKAHADRYPGSSYVQSRISILRENMMTVARNFVPVILGTDEEWLPGINTHLELEAMVGAGFTPIEALYAGTTYAARYLREIDRVGSLVIGKDANLLILDGDPSRDIRNTRKIASVVRLGRFYSPKKLLDEAKR